LLSSADVSSEIIESFFANSTVEDAEQASVEEVGTCQAAFDENTLRSRIRELKRKRNRIEDIKKKMDSGEDAVMPDELLLVNEYDDTLRELERLERKLY
jgi:hypothetical protein